MAATLVGALPGLWKKRRQPAIRRIGDERGAPVADDPGP